MSKNIKKKHVQHKTRHGQVAGQSTNPSSENKEFDMSNFSTDARVNQLNEEVPQLPLEARVSEELGLDACHWLDRYVDFSRIWSPESFDGYHEACGLFILSTVAARRVVFDLGGVRATNLYILLVGRTSIYAKSTAAEIGIDLLRATGLDWLLAPDEITPQKLVENMSSNVLPDNFDDLDDFERQKAIHRISTAGQRGWFVDEFGGIVSAMMKSDGVMSGIKGLVRTLDGAPQKYDSSTITRGQDLILNPYLTIMGNITIADLAPYSKKGTTLWGDGFNSRFATITPHSDHLNFGRFPNQERVFPESLITPIVNWNKKLGFPESQIIKSKERNILKFEPLMPKHLKIRREVFEAYYNYHDALRMLIWKSKNQDLDGNYARLPEKALRIAALFASISDFDSIELNHWAKAQAIAEGWRVGLHELYRQVNVINKDQPTKFIKDLPIEDQVMRAVGKMKMPDMRKISQFTGHQKDIVEPALTKLVSENKILPIKDNGRSRFMLPK